MNQRSFDADAAWAHHAGLPVPRGIAFKLRNGFEDRQPVETHVQTVLPGWDVQRDARLPGWYEARPPATADPIPLGPFWEQIAAVGDIAGIEYAEPILLVEHPQPQTAVEQEAFARGFGQEQFGLWGLPYDDETQAEIARQLSQHKIDWHLEQMRVPAAYTRWRVRYPQNGGEPTREPGDGVIVGHPDTGYARHAELIDQWRLPGHSYLEGEEGGDGRDDLSGAPNLPPSNPGHGTATASIIASPARAAPDDVRGVAPGAKILPLRVSRSVIHIDFGNLASAIMDAADDGAHVISMSLGGLGPFKLRRLRAAIRYAHDRGVIVIAAAGDGLPVTVLPAAFPEVIAVAATNAAGTPWRFTGMGALVDIAAPGDDVWHACAEPGEDDAVGASSGTSFATACVAGLAALWLSYHGGRDEVARLCGIPVELVPFAFQYALAQSADVKPDLARDGRYGRGIADADKLLEDNLPTADEVRRFTDVIRTQPGDGVTLFAGLAGRIFGVAPTARIAASVDSTVAGGAPRTDPLDATPAAQLARAQWEAQERLFDDLLDVVVAGPGVDRRDYLVGEVLALIAADRTLLVGVQRWQQGASLLPLLDRLLRGPRGMAGAQHLSAELAKRLQRRRKREEERLRTLHRAELVPGVVITLPGESEAPDQGTLESGSRPTGASVHGPLEPAVRLLRAYAMDPSLETRLDTSPINQVTLPTRWENVRPGPIGEYLEVVDVDPASGCAYSPVDLNHPYILARQGLPPSEGDPQFHQQMVYAVAMATINHFERALGRPIFWSPLRPWLTDRPEEAQQYIRPDGDRQRLPEVSSHDRLVQRLRIHPHALREANAYYSPTKRAVLFGYFPGADDDTGTTYPSGMVFTCLSHDIIAHEMTHALLDGMHPYFNEPSNEDVWAFHEAFADIMALFQHFSYAEVLRQQIAATRGDLQENNLLAQLAQQFGQATGKRGALRSALGGEVNGRWERRRPDPRALLQAREPHERGSILVAAVFDAFLALYNNRVADLIRLASGGSGILAAGRIHPDLVNRLADAAALTAEEILHTCIRAMDYVPPVDITFGEFLRALITADFDRSPTERRTRIAFIDAFRSWGIYPRDVTTLSEDSLRWHAPREGQALTSLKQYVPRFDHYEGVLRDLIPALESWKPGASRAPVFRTVGVAQAGLHDLLEEMQGHVPVRHQVLPGLDLHASFNVGNLRPVRRLGPRGEFLTEMVVEVVQTDRSSSREDVPFRGGATLVVEMGGEWPVRYALYKRLYAPGGSDGGDLAQRSQRSASFQQRRREGAAGAAQAIWGAESGADFAGALAQTYGRPGSRGEPFALLHQNLE